MAVNFQRRNVGVLADIPTFADVGQSAYVDYAAGAPDAGSMIRQETTAPSEGPVEGEVLPPVAVDDYETRARAALAQMEQAALRQKKAAGNPLNVVSSVLGGVIGLPFNFLDNALGGAQNDLTAPFRPKQNAETRYQNALASIGERRANFERDLAGVRASNAQALRTSMGAGREAEQAGYDALGNLTSAMLYMTPEAKAERIPALQALAKRFPDVAPAVQEVIEGGFNPAVLATYGSMSSTEGARQRANEFLYGNKTVATGDGTALIISNRPDVAPQFIDRSATDSQFRTVVGLPAIGGQTPAAPVFEPTMENTPRPELGPNGVPEVLTPDQYYIISKELGKEKTDAWMQQHNIVVEQPQGQPAVPSQDAIDAELRRRGLIK